MALCNPEAQGGSLEIYFFLDSSLLLKNAGSWPASSHVHDDSLMAVR